MKISAEELRNAWDALPQMDMLAKARLEDADFVLIARAREDSDDPAFCKRLPLTVAHVTEAAQKEMMELALTAPPNLLTSLTVRDKEEYSLAAIEFAKRYLGDITIINHALLGTRAGQVHDTEVELGKYKTMRAWDLHCDQFVDVEGKPRGCWAYAARIENLPTHFIKKTDTPFSDKIKTLLEDTKYMTTRGLEARKILLEQEILAPSELGAVMLLRNVPSPNHWARELPAFKLNELGTWHCSAQVPDKGVYSAFLRAGAYDR